MPRPHRAEEAGVLRLEGVNYPSASVHESTIRWTKTESRRSDGGLDFAGRQKRVRSGGGFQSFWFVVPGVFAIRASFRRLQDGERGWFSKLHSFGAMDFSRAGTERRFSSPRLFLLVAFSRGLHESFSTCLAKDTTEATSPSVRVLPLECCLLRPCPFLHAQLLLLRYVALPQLAFPVDGICALTSSSTDLRSTATYLRSSLLLRTLRHRRSKSSSVEQSRIKAARRFEQLQRQPIPFLELRLGPR